MRASPAVRGRPLFICLALLARYGSNPPDAASSMLLTGLLYAKIMGNYLIISSNISKILNDLLCFEGIDSCGDILPISGPAPLLHYFFIYPLLNL